LFKLATSGKLGSQIERDSNEQETAYERHTNLLIRFRKIS
jgi:hypothetical protein